MTAYTRNTTTRGITSTTEGDIPHKPVTLADGTRILAPVRIGRCILRNGHYLPMPGRGADGALQFVLPGGGVSA